MDVPLPPLFPGLMPTTNNMIRGSGILSWLSPKAGLINCSKPMATVSFQIKDFCDSGVTDLTQYLRVGFRLAFHTIPNTTGEWIANYVTPISDQDLANGAAANDGQEPLNLESFEQNNMPPGKAGKDTYSLEKEMRALAFLLSIFQKNAVHYIPLSNLHSRISNSGDQELSRYIGSSSLKRRQFIEDRSYIFHLAENDVVYLQAPEIYHTVMQLAGFLLTHGGVTSSDLLFTFFNKSGAIPSAIKESIQNPPKAGRPNFMQFLSRHPFAFAPFPSQYYVGVRRNLPFFDYATFIRRVRETQEKKVPLANGPLFPHPQSFPNFHQNSSASSSSRPVSRPLLQQSATNEGGSFDGQLSPVDGPLLALGGAMQTVNPLASSHSLSGMANGFPHSNGHGTSGGGINGLGTGAGGSSNSLAHSFMQHSHQQQQHSGLVTPLGQQKTLFSLFDDPIVPNPVVLPSVASIVPSATAPSSIHQHHQQQQHQNGQGIGLRSIVGQGSGGGSSSNGTGAAVLGGGGSSAANNIWKYDMDFNLTDAFSNTLSLGERASPPRKQFVEKEVQTEECHFCANCAQKIGISK